MKKGLKKAYELMDAKIQFVSLVDKAANKRQFLIKKEAEGKASFTTYGRIIKKDTENHYVTGVVYEPMEEDSHGNFMTEAEITKAAYWFAKNGDKVDLQHSFENLDGATVVENWIAKADFKIDGEEIKKGTWLMTVEVADDTVWESIEKGDITGFSMGGLGSYSEEDVELDKVSKTQEVGEKKGLLKQIAKALGLEVVEKGEMAELYEESSRGSLFWNAFDSLERVLRKYNSITGCWAYEVDEDKVRESLEDFNEIITSVLTGKESVTKALQVDKKIKNAEVEKEGAEVNKQEIEKIVADAVAKSVATLNVTAVPVTEVVEKAGSNDDNNASTEITAATIEKMVAAAIQKATEPKEEPITADQIHEMITSAVAKAVEPVLKSKGLPSNLNSNNIEKTTGEEHYLQGIL